MKQFFLKKWFLIGLAVTITGGILNGWQRPQGIESITEFVHPRWLTGFVLFLMSITLDSRQLRASFRAPAPVLLAVGLNYLVVPAAAWALMSIQLSEDFRFGLMIAGSVPCTMAAASVWTRKARGNDAVSLLVTMSTNAICFIVTPLWLNTAIPTGAAHLDAWEMVRRLVETVLIPCSAGQLLRQWGVVAGFATRAKTVLGVVAQSLVLVLVLFAALKSGRNLAVTNAQMSLLAVAVVWASCVGIHTTVLFAGRFFSGKLGFTAADGKAVAIAGSQKTLPIGVYIATDPAMFGAFPFAVFPMLMYHASQLFVDTAVADRWAAEADAAPAESATAAEK
ncbi:Sodium Bile acid symporter family protein [Symmachiella dynata]|uniref:Sodium Bile acid symporter family protein n=1 Tax=Symmachiella dynata TaxID=2527995 RepID=A0A517ZWP6_9PLAN|nr:bile acid:sodium symporter [Symmachiella dynata]QDU46878.1 Sodium Bile acid symporter family protein [Symmachiella dynata]